MKRFIIALVAFLAVSVVSIAQYSRTYQLTSESGTITRMYESYSGDSIITWEINTGTNQAIRFDYSIDIDPNDGYDEVRIFAIKPDGTSQVIKTKSSGQPAEQGQVVSAYLTGRARVVLNEVSGCQSEVWGNGTGISISYNTIPQENVVDSLLVTSYVGIGTFQPLQPLHVAGNVRGGGAYGELKIQCDNGYLELGSNGTNATFKTDKSSFLFNKPVIASQLSTSGVSNLSFGTHNTTRMTILYSNGYVGIGTSAPQALLDVMGDIKGNTLTAHGLTVTGATISYLNANNMSSTSSTIGTLSSTSATIRDISSQDITSDRISADAIQAQNIYAEDILVRVASGADFVFENGYQMPTLSALGEYLMEHKHLPEIPSANDMQNNGVSMTELQIMLLQKIEELTLYTIQQQEQIEQLKSEIKKLKEE